MAGTRFQIRIDPIWQPLLIVGGATRDNSYVELDGDIATARFGLLFRRDIPRSHIEEAAAIDWPWYMGVGWRSNLRDQLGLIGSYQGVVELRLNEPIRVMGLLSCTRLAVSVEEPEAFLAAIGSRATAARAART